MIDRSAKLSIVRQAKVLGISRGSVYYKPRPVSDADLNLMHRMDKRHMEFSFAGSRMLPGLLVQEGFKVGRLHDATLMKRKGIEALYRKPNTSKQAPGHKIYPYLLRKLPITRPNQVWTMPCPTGASEGCCRKGHHLHSPSRQICVANRLPGNGWRAGSSTSPLCWTGCGTRHRRRLRGGFLLHRRDPVGLCDGRVE